MRIELTPVPKGLPVLVGGQIVHTGDDGQFTALVDRLSEVSISSGLAAIAITPVVGIGADLAANSPLDIPGYRLLEPGSAAPCKVFLDSQEYVVWPYVNSTLETLEVPLTLNYLNNMGSPAGAAVPDTLFVPGASSFMEPLESFVWGGGYLGEWNILGRTVQLPDPLLVCADSGDEGECRKIPPATFRDPFESATDIVTDVIAEAVRLERAGKWRGNGQRSVFAVRGPNTLLIIRKLMRDVQGRAAYVCEADQIQPASCREMEFPRAALRKAMMGLFSAKNVPDGLRSIVSPSRVKRTVNRFEKSFERAPKKYWRCS